MFPAIAVLTAFLVVSLCYAFNRWRNRDYYAAMRLVAAGDYDGAIARLQSFLKRRPFSLAYNDLAVLYISKGMAREALPLLDKAEACGGRHSLFLDNRGVALMKLGMLTEALVAFDAAAKRNPNSARIAFHRAEVLADMHRFGEARAALQRAEQIAASNSSSAKELPALDAQTLNAKIDSLESAIKPSNG